MDNKSKQLKFVYNKNIFWNNVESPSKPVKRQYTEAYPIKKRLSKTCGSDGLKTKENKINQIKPSNLKPDSFAKKIRNNPSFNISSSNTSKPKFRRIQTLNITFAEDFYSLDGWNSIANQEQSKLNNLNININIQQYTDSKVQNTQQDEGSFILPNQIENNSNIDPVGSSMCLSPVRRKSQNNWRRVSNIFKSFSLFNKHKLTNIQSNLDVESEIKKYENKLKKGSMTNKSQSDTDYKESKFNSKIDNELLKVYLKNSFQKIILNGDKNEIQKAEHLFEQNPDRYSRGNSDKDFLFNAPLQNGKTLLYTACQEGNLKLVIYMLDRGLNPLVKSTSDNDVKESVLDVSCRWNYTNLVEYLLSVVEFPKQDIKNALKVSQINSRIKNMLKKYYKKHLKNKSKCSCF